MSLSRDLGPRLTAPSPTLGDCDDRRPSETRRQLLCIAHSSLPNMSNRYQPIPTSEDSAPVPQPETLAEGQGEDRDRSHRPLRAGVEAEFNRRPPAWYKRAGLVLAIIFMAWIAIRLGSWNRSTQPKVIYASRFVSPPLPSSAQMKRSPWSHADTDAMAGTVKNTSTARPRRP